LSTELFLGAAGVLAALLAAFVVPRWIFRKEIRERIFFEYSSRYGEISEHLPSEVFGQNFDPEKLKSDDVTLRWVRAYFDLSSEEIKLHIRYRLPREVWADWEEAIRDAMDSPTGKWARKALGLDEQYQVFRRFVDGRERGLEEASAEYKKPKTWSDGKYR